MSVDASVAALLKLGIWPIVLILAMPALLVLAAGIVAIALVAVLNESACGRLERLIGSVAAAVARVRAACVAVDGR